VHVIHEATGHTRRHNDEINTNQHSSQRKWQPPVVNCDYEATCKTTCWQQAHGGRQQIPGGIFAQPQQHLRHSKSDAYARVPGVMPLRCIAAKSAGESSRLTCTCS
jgi:hypothetical protein